MTELPLSGLLRVARRVAVYVHPLEIESGVTVEVDAREGFPAASVIKVGIMSRLLESVEAGEHRLSDEIVLRPEDLVGGAGVLHELSAGRSYNLGELCRLMMVVSDNSASNALLRLFGLEAINTYFQARGYQASFGRYFMEAATPSRDNLMTAEAAGLMLKDLYLGRYLSPMLQDFALGCLRRQQYREKIPLLLPETLTVGHKTGELLGVRHDAAVVEAEAPYILVVLTADGGPPWEVDRAIAEYSLAIYRERTSRAVDTV